MTRHLSVGLLALGLAVGPLMQCGGGSGPACSESTSTSRRLGYVTCTGTSKFKAAASCRDDYTARVTTRHAGYWQSSGGTSMVACSGTERIVDLWPVFG